MAFSKVQITDNANSLLNMDGTKFYEVGVAPAAIISRAIAQLLGWLGRVTPRAEMRARVQASHGIFTVLSHLNLQISTLKIIEKLDLSQYSL